MAGTPDVANFGMRDAKAPKYDPTKYVAPVGMQLYRAPSLLQPHRARQALKDAHNGVIPPLVGIYLMWASPPVAKMAAQFGYDFAWIDWEHAAMNVETMTQVGFPLGIQPIS